MNRNPESPLSSGMLVPFHNKPVDEVFANCEELHKQVQVLRKTLNMERNRANTLERVHYQQQEDVRVAIDAKQVGRALEVAGPARTSYFVKSGGGSPADAGGN